MITIFCESLLHHPSVARCSTVYPDVGDVKPDLRFLIRFYRSKAYIKERIQSGVTAATAKKIATGKRPKKYFKEDISAGTVLHAISPKAFNLIRKKGWMQLPARRTVEEWLKNFTNEEGLQKTLVNIVKAKHPELAAQEVFLSFDEMALR